MLKALMLKELRETAWIALVGLVAHLAFVANCVGYDVLPFWRPNGLGIPFSTTASLCCFALSPSRLP